MVNSVRTSFQFYPWTVDSFPTWCRQGLFTGCIHGGEKRSDCPQPRPCPDWNENSTGILNARPVLSLCPVVGIKPVHVDEPTRLKTRFLSSIPRRWTRNAQQIPWKIAKVRSDEKNPVAWINPRCKIACKHT